MIFYIITTAWIAAVSLVEKHVTVENLCDWLTESIFDYNYLITQADYGKNFQMFLH
jgi:hypothetical protein